MSSSNASRSTTRCWSRRRDTTYYDVSEPHAMQDCPMAADEVMDKGRLRRRPHWPWWILELAHALRLVDLTKWPR